MVIIADKFYRNAVILMICGIIGAFLIYKGVFFWKCPFAYFLKLECPGCGVTRALHSLMHGEIIEAIKLNPIILLFPLFPVSILLLVYDIILNKTIFKSITYKFNNFISRYQIWFIGIAFIYVISIIFIKNFKTS